MPDQVSPAARRALSYALLLPMLFADVDALSAELKKETAAAFDRYAQLTEARVQSEVRDPQKFLWVDTLPAARRQQVYAQLRRGEVVIERAQTRDARGRELKIPDGIVHHWMGTVFIPNATLKQTLELVQDYDNHQKVYAPDVVRSKLLARNGDHFRIFLRFWKKKILTVVTNTEHEVQYYTLDPSRAYSLSRTTRIAEVENPGEPQEREKPVGNDHGFLWRLNSYWRFQEKDGGVYVQCEAISLTRDIPAIVSFIVKPFVTGVPKESLQHTLGSTRAALVKPAPTAGR